MRSSKRQLLFSVTKKDLEITFYSGRGPGGTNRNKVQNCVRIRHPASGAIVTAQEHRERPTNIRNALKRLVADPKFHAWWSRRCYEIETGQSLEEAVDLAMRPENLRIEGRKAGVWVLLCDDENTPTIHETAEDAGTAARKDACGASR